MDDKEFPEIPEALLQRLESLFPERSADLRWPDREVWFKAGQCSVVKMLRLRYESQLENHMTKGI
jgi:hypothetical protein